MSQCTGKSKRSGKRCLKWAIRGKATCRMHGGKSRGPKTKIGKEKSRRAVLRHGAYTKESLTFRKKALALIKHSINILNLIEQNSTTEFREL